jgi:GNAT superfamily N-acetyltransferase
MKPIIKVIKNKEEIEKYSKYLIKHRLYVNGYTFRSWLENYDIIKLLVIYYNDKNIPVGLSILINDDKEDDLLNCGVYVKPKYRNMGIGSKLMRVVKKYKKDIKVKIGIKNSNIFYNKCGINCEKY